MLKIDNPIIVIGYPRSGTSLTAGLLVQHGVWVGECRNADPRNPKGFFENNAFTSYIKHNKYITEEKVKNILYNEGYKGGPWLVKHSVINKWNKWKAFNPIYVLCYRDINSIIESTKNAKKYKGNYHEFNAEKEEKSIRKTIKEMNYISENYNSVVVYPVKFIEGDFSALGKILNKVGLELDERKCLDFTDKSLWKRKKY